MNRSFSAHDLAAIAMSVALIAVCSWISVPTTIPFTMQTFAVCLVAAVFGLRHGVWAVLCYTHPKSWAAVSRCWLPP